MVQKQQQQHSKNLWAHNNNIFDITVTYSIIYWQLLAGNFNYTSNIKNDSSQHHQKRRNVAILNPHLQQQQQQQHLTVYPKTEKCCKLEPTTTTTTYGISENGEMRHFWSYNGSDDLSGVNSHPHPQSVFALMKDVELACLVSNQNQSCNVWLPHRVIHEWRHVYVCQAFVI